MYFFIILYCINMTNNRNVVFLGERLKLSPPPLHPPKFEEYKPYRIKTDPVSIHQSEYPYVNMRFQHLANFHISHSKFVHPNLKDLDIEPVKMFHEKFEVEHLGIKPEMDKKSHPNESKFQMGLGKKATVKDFAEMNLEADDGGENTLTRHRDEAEYEDITALPFEEQYLRFLKKKEKVKEFNTRVCQALRGNARASARRCR